MRVTPKPLQRGLACLLAVCALGVAAPIAAADCGQSVIDSYFETGAIGYHSQACYAAALREVDADAKMYSGIMGAIRSARARDAAADAAKSRKADGVATTDGAADAATTTEASGGSATTAGADTAPADPQPTTDEQPSTQVVDAAQPSDAALPAEQASAVAAAQDAGPPLAMIVLAALGALLALVGIGGLVVRRLDRGA